MSETTRQFKKQLPKNAIAAVISFLTYTVSAFWLTPYLYQHIGAAAYGLVPIAGLFTQFVAIITDQVSGAVNRFLTIEIQKTDGNPNIIFNSSFTLYLLLILIQLPLFVVGLIFADKLVAIPPELKTDALLLLGFSAGSFLINLLAAVFGVSLYSKNRLDIGNYMVLTRLILRLVLIFACFTLFGGKLRYIGIIDFALTVMIFVVHVFMWRKFTPELVINFKYVHWKVLGPVFHMSVWTLLNQLGALLYQRTDIFILYRFVSPVIAGQYAAILVVANFIRQIASLGNGQLGPVTMAYWARQELDELRKLLTYSVKIFSFGLAIPIALLCVNSGYILPMWLGGDFEGVSLLFTVMTVHLCINTAVLPLFHLFTASNSVKLPALVTFLMGILNVIVSYLLGVTAGLGAMGVALATALVLSMKNALFTPIYAAHILRIRPRTFILPLIGSLPVIGVVYALATLPLAEWLGLARGSIAGMAVQTAVITALAGWCGWMILFPAAERRRIWEAVTQKFYGLKTNNG